MATRFSEAYADLRAGLASEEFAPEKGWPSLVNRARKLAGVDGLEVSEASVVDDLRRTLAKADGRGNGEAASLMAACAAGTPPAVDAALAARLGALKTLRHTYLLKRFGAHKVWCVAIPPTFTDWPCEALKGGLGTAAARLADTTDRFSVTQRKDISHASQQAMKWVHKAMIVAGDAKSKKNFDRVARWFADGTCTDNDVVSMSATINAGLKKICARLKSGRLIYTDSVSERGTSANAGTEAFVWGDPMDVVYIEEEFFGRKNTLTGLTN